MKGTGQESSLGVRSQRGWTVVEGGYPLGSSTISRLNRCSYPDESLLEEKIPPTFLRLPWLDRTRQTQRRPSCSSSSMSSPISIIGKDESSRPPMCPSPEISPPRAACIVRESETWYWTPSAATCPFRRIRPTPVSSARLAWRIMEGPMSLAQRAGTRDLPTFRDDPDLTAVAAAEIGKAFRQRGGLRRLRVTLRAVLRSDLRERGGVCHVHHGKDGNATRAGAASGVCAHLRRSRTSHTSPHSVQRRDTKCALRAAMTAAVAVHSGHGSTLRAGSAPGNWIMVSETVAQARPFSNHREIRVALIRKCERSSEISSEAHRWTAGALLNNLAL